MLIVAGMHRSGTSALARTLSLCGMALPQNLMPPSSDNPDGYWESSQISAFNEELLRSADTSWDDPLASRALSRGVTPQGSLERASALLNAEYIDPQPGVFKDPRVSLLLPFWRDAIVKSERSAKVVIAVRNPLEVANSLLARDGFPVAKGVLLWLEYLLAAERDSRGLARAFVSYDDLLVDWRMALARVERKLVFRLPHWTTSAEIQIDKFLSADRRHHKFAARLRPPFRYSAVDRRCLRLGSHRLQRRNRA